ncbi:MAG: hypothetical protein WC291_09550 [Thermodesulfovibrionales bacterium]|jgi:hypothetical protein
MNLAQVTRLAQYQADIIKQAGTAGSFVTSYELDSWANRGNEILEKALRNLHEDYFVKRMVSTDTTAQTIQGISYTPTTLQLAANTQIISLPPDILTIKSIKCVTSGYEAMPIEHLDMASGRFQDLYRSASTDTIDPGDTLYWDVYANRSLLLAQPLSSAVDIELLYVAKTKRLVRYSTGTVAVTTGTAAVAGTNTVWTYIPLDSTYLDIHFGTSASATLPTPEPSYEYDGVNRMRVSSITDATNLVLTADKSGTLAAGTGYILASLPQAPEEFHTALADYVTHCILFKAKSGAARGWYDKWAATLKELNSTASRRQSTDIEVVEGWAIDNVVDTRMA